MSKNQQILKEMAKENKELERFPDYIYISSFDLIRSPDLILKKIQLKLEQAKIVCLNCKDYTTFKFTANYWSFKCQCGLHLFYPPRKDRGYAYGHRFISKEEYDRHFKNRPISK